MNILVSLDKNYTMPLRVMLKSLFLNNPATSFTIYLLHSDIPAGEIKSIETFCHIHKSALQEVPIPEAFFAEAPVNRYYSKAMYYRLLAHLLLPGEIDRALYLDPDILILNPVENLYNSPVDDWLYAACIHSGFSGISDYVNKIRLSNYEAEGYFNSGVLLMNLQRLRNEVSKEDIYQFVANHKGELILPDQDVLNGLYGSRILSLDDSLYNLDARRLDVHWLLGDKNLDWIMANTVVLHFCGKSKPWEKNKIGPFASLYKHYMQLAAREQI